MKTDGITRLISALGRPAHQAYQSQQSQSSVQQETQVVQQQQQQRNDDAVKISLSSKDGSADRVRQEKVEALKAQVENGSYNPSSEVVAVALTKELGI